MTTYLNLYYLGFDAYANQVFCGTAAPNLATKPEPFVRGYRAAQRAQADADTAQYLDARDPGPSIEDDAEWLRTGAW